MLPNPLLRKLIQISEEALPAVHVPLVLGNDSFILTQQDVRKVEDVRLFSISKIMPNGELKTINTQDPAAWLQQNYKQGNFLYNQAVVNLLQLLNSCFQEFQQKQYLPTNQISTTPQPMEVSSNVEENRTAVASIEQQLEWSKCNSASPPFPLHYSQGTSTIEFNYKQSKERHMPICSCKKLCDKSNNTEELHNNSNKILDAREQLKLKKLNNSFT